MRAINPQVSLQVEDAVAHAMAMHPDDRPSSIAEFGAELFGGQPTPRQAQGKISEEPNMSYPQDITNLTLRDALWNNRVLLLLLGLLLAMAVAVTALPAERPNPTTPPTARTTIEANHLP